MCGKCCTGFDDGEVYLYKEDILRLAEHLNMNTPSGLKLFARKYIKVIEDEFFWKVPGEQKEKNYKFLTLGFKFAGKDEQCHFLQGKICIVHEFRPFQCRSFPFWQMMVSNKLNIETYKKKCKGLQLSGGKFYSKDQILEWAQNEYEIEKNYFLEMKKNKFNILKVYPFLSKDMLKEKE